jgi:hypothetical protein
MESDDLVAEIQEARNLLWHIEMELDSGRMNEASYFASELAEILWKARLLDLQAESGNPA